MAKHKELSFCQKLVHQIDRQERVSRNRDAGSDEQPRHCKLLTLPAELRQLIFYHTISDYDFTNSKLKRRQGRRIAKACRILEADMKWVRKHWRERELILQKQKMAHKGEFDGYIAELMEPVMSASAALKKRNHTSNLSKKRERNSKHADQKQASILAAKGDYQPRGKGWIGDTWSCKKWEAQSQAELDEAAKWRERREMKIQKMKKGPKSSRLGRELAKIEREKEIRAERKKRELEMLEVNRRVQSAIEAKRSWRVGALELSTTTTSRVVLRLDLQFQLSKH